MAYTSHTKKVLIVTGIIALVLAFGYGYAVNEVFRTNRAASALSADVHAKAARAELARSTRDLLAQTEADRAALDNLFIADSEIASFLEHIEALGSITGVTLDVSGVDVTPPEQDQNVYEWLSVSVSVEGSWASIYRFLSVVEHLPLALTVDTVRLSAITDSEDADISWKSTIDFRVAKKKPL